MSPFLEAHHDAAVGCYAVAVMKGFKEFNQDDVAVAMECEYDIAAERAVADGEPDHAISIKFTDRIDDHVVFFNVVVGI